MSKTLALIFFALFSLAFGDFPYVCEVGTRCFPEIADGDKGCFEQGPFTPFCHQIFLPESPKDIGTEIYFYTTDGSETVIDFYNLQKVVSGLKFDKSKEFWVIVHGFGGRRSQKEWMLAMKDSLIDLDNNVMVIYWLKGSQAPDYLQATANTRVIGAVIGRIIEEMQSVQGLDTSLVTITGFSLGAHVAGFAGERIRPKVRRIIGLDPAGALYEGESTLTRLDTSDANLVQCIHANGDSFFEGGCGTLQPMGHIDFYANGGVIQPGCHHGVYHTATDVWHLNFSAIFGDLACSHFRAHKIFQTTLDLELNKETKCKFIGYPCYNTNTWIQSSCFPNLKNNPLPTVGYNTDFGTKFRGKYFFSTRAFNDTETSYCGNPVSVTLKADVAVEGTFSLKFFDGKEESDEVPFYYEEVKLEKEQPTTRVLSIPLNIKFPTYVQLTYERKDLLYAEKFNLLEVLVTKENGKILQSTNSTPVTNEVPARVNLS